MLERGAPLIIGVAFFLDHLCCADGIVRQRTPDELRSKTQNKTVWRPQILQTPSKAVGLPQY